MRSGFDVRIALLKIERQAFAWFFRRRCRVQADEASRDLALELSGAVLFDPSEKGRPMKDWVAVPKKHRSHWLHFAECAINNAC